MFTSYSFPCRLQFFLVISFYIGYNKNVFNNRDLGGYPMINNLTFENFRGLKKIHLPELGQVTLISGKNNAGKSSILEGIFLAIDHIAPESFVKINRFRGLSMSTDPSVLWAPMFYDLNTKETLRISMQLDDVETVLTYSRDDSFVPSDAAGAPQDVFNQFISSAKSTYTLKFHFSHGDYTEDGHFVVSSSGVLRNVHTSSDNNQLLPMPFTQYINASIINNDSVITEWFGKLEIEGKKQQVIDVLRIIDASICDISTIAFQGQIQLYAKMGEKLLPLKLAGDGINKLLFIVLSIIANPNSVILIDEIETGFHFSMYAKLWEIISIVAQKNNCQIIATTHSYECINGAIDGIETANMQNAFCYYRIERADGENKAFRYSGDLVRSAINFSMEVR